MNFPDNPAFLKCVTDSGISQEELDELEYVYSGQLDFKDVGNGVYCHIPTMFKTFGYIAAFDLDWTLAYNEHALFPRDPDDIQILPDRREFLVSLLKKGYSLAVFTNQKAKSKSEKEKKVERVRNFLEKIRLPLYTFVSTEDNDFRKPGTGMFKIMKKYLSPERLYFIGDALGRPQDFSDSDRLFGEGIGATVYSPEDVFPASSNPVFKSTKELVITVGMGGSGKSTYVVENLSSHVRVNQDTLKTKAKVDKLVDSTMKTGASLVIDATNPTQERREEFYALAKRYGYTVKVLYIVRNGKGWNDLREERVPTIAYHIYFKNLEPPTQKNTPGELYVMWW
jgi:bifunctional polynucleotide phosphatase/kinase